MPRLFLLTAISPNFLWLAHTFAANARNLSGLSLGPLAPGAYIALSNSHFWGAPQSLPNDLITVKSLLYEGRDVLLVGGSLDPDAHGRLAESLKKSGINKIASIQPWLVIGRPALLMEKYSRNITGRLDSKIQETALRCATSIGNIVKKNRELWGDTHFLADTAQYCSAKEGYGLAEKLCAAWNVGGLTEMPKPAPALFFFNSVPAVRMARMARVRDNDWPRLDDAAFLAAILNNDRGAAYISQLSFRRQALPKLQAEQKKLENMLELDTGSLAEADSFALEEELGWETPLDPALLDNFATSLSDDVAATLSQRYTNDERFLTPDQRDLDKLLKARVGFTHIGSTRETPLLTVLTMTRNHEKYITKCMESVQEQKTDFPVRHLVLDHYSNDATPEIINSYAHKYPSIRPILLKRGSGIANNVWDLFSRCQSRYAALCDGDDYFIDVNKLQKQVDYLEANPDCSIVFHPVMLTFENGDQPVYYPPVTELPRRKNMKFYLMDLTRANLIQTNSAVYRWRFPEGLPDWFRCDLCPGDWYWHLLHAETGKIGFIPKVMSVYRRHANALYANSFRDPLKHRRQHGLAELEAYHAYNEHFKGHYFKSWAQLANGVLADFLMISINQNDSSLLDLAMYRYPDFAKFFINSLDIEHKRLLNNSPAGKDKAVAIQDRKT